MHIFLDNFHQDGKYSDQISSHQVELRREGGFTDQKYLSISSLQTDYRNIYSNSGYGINGERANRVQIKCTFCGGDNHFEENNSKGSESKRRKLLRLVIWTKDVRNVRL